jgi:hypothetical protein
MADAVTSQIISDGAEIVMKFTNLSDGTGESAVLKVDASTLAGAPAALAIQKIVFATQGMSVNILWDATTDVPAWVVPADQSASLDFGPNGILNNAGAGKTGDIMFTTVGHTAGDSYSIMLFMRRRSL